LSNHEKTRKKLILGTKAEKHKKRITKEGYKNFSFPRSKKFIAARKRNGDEMKEKKKIDKCAIG